MKERIEEKIADIEKYLSELEAIVPIGLISFKTDLKTKAACERYFEKIIEAVVDLAFLIIRKFELRNAKDDADTFIVLAESGFINKELSEKLQDAKSMRNLIVHQYEIVEDGRVHEAVKDKLPEDVKNFLKQIERRVR